MDDVTPTRKSRSDLERDRAVWRDLLAGFALLAVVFGAMFATDADGPSFASAAWSLLTLIGAVLLLRAEVRRLRRADEYPRTLQLEALAFGFAVVVLLTLAAGLLDAAGLGDPRQSLQISFIGGILAWRGRWP